jgi:hypothetical protein
MAATLAMAGLAAVTLWRYAPLLRCIGGCFVDFETLRGPTAPLLHLQYADTRLNAWILAWVQHALVGNPRSVFDANVLYPAPDPLVGSEHLLGLAVQLLPFRLGGAGAVAVHQIAIVLSGFLTGATTFWLVRWTCRSSWPAFLAGATAILLPWRISELAHVQLLAMHWIPLVWLLLARTLVQGPSWPRALALVTVLGLQLLTSYYLAYFTLASCAVLIVAIVPTRASSSRKLTAATVLCVAATIPLVMVSLPYLAAGVGSERVLAGQSVASYGIGAVVRHLTGPASSEFPWQPSYRIPMAVLLLAGASGAVFVPTVRRRFFRKGRWAVVPALWTMAALAFVFALGEQLTLGGLSYRLPAALAADWIPGFAQLRAPLRWGILACTATVALAGCSLAMLEAAVARLPRLNARYAVLATRTVCVLLLVAGLPRIRIPVADAYQGTEKWQAAYRALASLPRGPVVELPWPVSPDAEATLASQYMLGSTGHWQPLLNGYTAYMPPTYGYLRRLAQRLPDRSAVDHLVALTGLRWIVVHADPVDPGSLARWSAEAQRASLVIAYQDESTTIYEAVDRSRAGQWLPALISGETRNRTFTGLGREPLALAPGSGTLAAAVPATLSVVTNDWLTTELRLTVTNASKLAWPGLDIDPRGLIALRYAFTTADGDPVLEQVAALDADIAPGTAPSFSLPLRGHLAPGRYRLRLDLVQQQEEGIKVLPVPAVETTVAVERIGR